MEANQYVKFKSGTIGKIVHNSCGYFVKILNYHCIRRIELTGGKIAFNRILKKYGIDDNGEWPCMDPNVLLKVLNELDAQLIPKKSLKLIHRNNKVRIYVHGADLIVSGIADGHIKRYKSIVRSLKASERLYNDDRINWNAKLVGNYLYVGCRKFRVSLLDKLLDS